MSRAAIPAPLPPGAAAPPARLPKRANPNGPFVDQIDLTDTNLGYTKWYKVPPGKFLVSVTIEKGSGFTWASAVADMQWAIKATNIDDYFAVTYSPAIQFTTSENSLAEISAVARSHVRVATTIAEDGADPAAKVIIEFY